MVIPTKGWDSYEGSLRSIGELRDSIPRHDLEVLLALGLVGPDNSLTAVGASYFRAALIMEDDVEAQMILAQCVLNYPPAAAILQLLFGVRHATRDKAEIILRSQSFGDELTDRKIGALLMLMHRAGVIEYERLSGTLRVKASPVNALEIPDSIFISPSTPYGNKAWLRRVIANCEGFIHWLDKHFMPIAFDAVWEAVDGERVGEVLVLSLLLPDHQGRRVSRNYKDLVTELRNRGVAFEWRTIPSSDIRDTHDRWLISKASARNIPNVNAIYSGQHSEMNRSDEIEGLEALFQNYWLKATPVF